MYVKTVIPGLTRNPGRNKVAHDPRFRLEGRNDSGDDEMVGIDTKPTLPYYPTGYLKILSFLT